MCLAGSTNGVCLVEVCGSRRFPCLDEFLPLNVATGVKIVIDRSGNDDQAGESIEEDHLSVNSLAEEEAYVTAS